MKRMEVAALYVSWHAYLAAAICQSGCAGIDINAQSIGVIERDGWRLYLQSLRAKPTNHSDMEQVMNDSNPTMSFTEAIATRRSVRSYAPGRLDREMINALLAAAIHAPTAIHEEPWAFVIVQGRPLLKHLSEIVRMPSTDERELVQAEESRQAQEKFKNPDFNIFYDAETLILICAKSAGVFVAADCWLAAENLMLAACAMGLGTCVIGSAVSGLNTRHVKASLDIAEETLVVVPIIVGALRAPSVISTASNRAKPLILSWQGSQE